MGAHHVVVVPLEEEDPNQSSLLQTISEAIQAERFPDLVLLPYTPIVDLHAAQLDYPQGIMFIAATPARRPAEVGRLTDLDLWNPREYKHELLTSWHRALTKAKKEGEIPPHARALFVHYEEAAEPAQWAALSLPLVRRIGLWTRFWSNHESQKATVR